jgi:hypothetical protein
MTAEPDAVSPAVDEPSGLNEAGLRLWRSILPRYSLRPDELRVLEDACYEADVIDRLQKELDVSPLVTAGSMGQEVAHPTVSEVRQHRTALRALLAQLKLPDTPAQNGARKAQVSADARKAARARWGSGGSSAAAS